MQHTAVSQKQGAPGHAAAHPCCRPWAPPPTHPHPPNLAVVGRVKGAPAVHQRHAHLHVGIHKKTVVHVWGRGRQGGRQAAGQGEWEWWRGSRGNGKPHAAQRGSPAGSKQHAQKGPKIYIAGAAGLTQPAVAAADDLAAPRDAGGPQRVQLRIQQGAVARERPRRLHGGQATRNTAFAGMRGPLAVGCGSSRQQQ